MFNVRGQDVMVNTLEVVDLSMLVYGFTLPGDVRKIINIMPTMWALAI